MYIICTNHEVSKQALITIFFAHFSRHHDHCYILHVSIFMLQASISHCFYLIYKSIVPVIETIYIFSNSVAVNYRFVYIFSANY